MTCLIEPMASRSQAEATLIRLGGDDESTRDQGRVLYAARYRNGLRARAKYTLALSDVEDAVSDLFD